MAGASKRVAVIDVGSNSTRLLVADVADGAVSKVERQSRVTRLGRGVDLTGQLSAEAIEATCEAIGDYTELCERFDVGATTTIATSAVRDASNGDAFVAELRERFALTARVLDGAEEARLTYLGATHERPPTQPTLVIDIGGGSTELIVGHDGGIDFEHSMQVGVVRHTERHISGDPPTAAELEELAADVRGSIEAAVPPEQANRVAAGIAVAGTPTSLAAVELELEPYDPERVHGQVLSLESIQRLLCLFASRPLHERREIVGLHPDRAPTIISGVVILVEAMRAFKLARIRVAEHDILYGAALQAAAANP
ncbi:MAG TPA: Ppx/GppA phosphatase family protein [Solirubrobacterales bacterium]|nr:Ppx/GppA phosphatase family protein [Solirubrobacterales bacterium]